jgi:hypothetical protein
MTDQMRSLSIRQVMDSSAYVSGAREFVAANKEMSSSSAVIGAVITQTQVKISNAADPVSRLTRAYDQTTASQLKFQAELTTLNRQLETNKISAEAASRIYAGLVKALGMSADGADITAQGFARMGAVISTTNKEMLEFGQVSRAIALASAEMEQMTQRGAALRAQLDPIGTSQARLNTELAEYNALLKAGQLNLEQFGSLENQARVRHEQFAASLNKTPGAANDSSGSYRRQNLAYQGFDIGTGLASGMPIGMIVAQQSGQIAQLYATAGGAKLLAEDTKAVMGGVASLARAAYAAIGPLPLIFGAVAIAAGAYYLLTRESAKTTDEVLKAHAENIKALGDAYGVAEQKAKSYSEADKAIASAREGKSADDLVAKQKDEINSLSDQFGALAVTSKGFGSGFHMDAGFSEFQDAFNMLRTGKTSVEEFVVQIKQIGDDKGIQKQARDVIEYTKELKLVNDQMLEHIRMQEQIQFPNLTARTDEAAAMAKLRIQNADSLANMQREHAASLAGIGAKSPAEIAAAARAQVMASPLNTGEDPANRQYRANAAGALAYAQAEDTLRQAKEERARASQSALEAAQNELSLIGKTVAEQTRLRAEYEATAQIKEAAARAGVKADETEIANARAKAAQIAQINQQVAAGKLVQGQQDEIQQLQLEAQLIGATVQQRARATAALQAEQQMRQQGIDTLSREGEQYKANAIIMAEARLEIERQNAAYQSLQQAEGSAIDAMVTGTGTLKERLKSAADAALQWFEQIAVANPLKNMLTGTNLPTLGDLFSGKPLVGAGATNTASMTVTAGTVMVNGGVSGLPGFPTSGVPGSTTTLGGFLGLGSNGVRPDLTSTGIVNSPLAAANQNMPSSMESYKQAISMIESGSPAGNYGALGPWTKSGDRAYGRYQIMGDNIPSWSEKYYGQRITPEQSLTNRAAQDAMFTGQFGADATKFGPTGAASKWFTGSPVVSQRADINGTTGSQYVDKFNQNLQKLNNSATSSAKDISGLGDSSNKVATTLTDTLGSNGTLSKAVVPQATAPAANYFPPAPSGGGFIGSLFSSIFSLFGFADGTDFAPGGMAWVGERGRELVHLPRGSAVTPNHKLNALGGGSQSVNMRHEYNITVGGNGDKELLERMHAAAEESIRVSMDAYDKNVLFKRISDYQQDPYARGS